MLITEQQLKEWEEIEKSATPGPWESINAYDYENIIIWQYSSKKEFVATENDIEFMQMARTAMPLLIKRVRELEEENMALHGLAIYPTK